jgi:myo-inositol-1(or 4)-monophosphatase
MSLNYKDICLSTIKKLQPVANFIKEEQSKVKSSDIGYKGLNDMVSYVDVQAEEKILKIIKEILPEAGVLGEELGESGENSQKGYCWIIDPIDGTTNYLHGIPFFAISLALTKDGEPVIGIVYEVVRSEIFYAWQGGGAYCNEASIRVSDTSHLKSALIATGFPYSEFGRMETFLQILRHLMQKSHGIRRIGSAALDLAYVASGRIDGFFELGLNPWDVAAGILLVREAGGTVASFSSKPEETEQFLYGKEIIATNKHIFNELQDNIKLNLK